MAVSDGRVFIIMDYAAKGDLLRYIQKVISDNDKFKLNIHNKALCLA